ncbi:FitA-like ribbon-helix-helix domain-containing protein [Brachybacterium muris]
MPSEPMCLLPIVGPFWAKEHGRSMEALVREILTRAARRPHIGVHC